MKVYVGDSVNNLTLVGTFTFEKGNLKMGKENQIIFTDPEIIGKELSFYLTNKPNVPIGIKENKSNDLKTWLNTL